MKLLGKEELRNLIIYSYETMLWELCHQDDEVQTEAIYSEKTQEEKFDILRQALQINLGIIDEIIKRYLNDQNKTEDFHKKIKGIDNFKKAGYVTFWISKLKPISIPYHLPPKEIQISSKIYYLLNEYLAITVACGILYPKNKEYPPFNTKILDDFIYKLRYRINTRHGLVLIYESLSRFFDYPSYHSIT